MTLSCRILDLLDRMGPVDTPFIVRSTDPGGDFPRSQVWVCLEYLRKTGHVKKVGRRKKGFHATVWALSDQYTDHLNSVIPTAEFQKRLACGKKKG